MILYHGSTIDIEKIDLALSKPNKDFGRAFYLSDNRQQALEMAQFRSSHGDRHLGMGACFHGNFFAIFLMVS